MIRFRHAACAAALVLAACHPRAEAPPAPEAPAANTAAAQTPFNASAAVSAPAMIPASTSAPQVQAPAPKTRVPEARLPEGPDMAPRRVPLEPGSCRAEIGEAASARLVRRCIRVSPATHPPCHADNPCAMIQEEIDRGCAMWTETDQPLPKECAA
ncbi:hypothetical protein [Brevundimonas naejangsanensis]|uniref:hypothetical protein n=1 Tax=Brevundimonas naejangsanensis TaxID=588932 RepID=UPI00196974CA|nr:hypothetical protein [Brevundimonas naejangsanensis]